jgi:hypothetical protein
MHRAGDILERANRKVLLPVIHTGGLICCLWPTGNRRGRRINNGVLFSVIPLFTFVRSR